MVGRAEAISEQSQHSAVGITPRAETKGPCEINLCAKGQGNQANVFARAFLQPSRDSGSVQGLSWPSFTNWSPGEYSCKDSLPEETTALKWIGRMQMNFRAMQT